MWRHGLGLAAFFTLACNGGAGSEASDTESGSETSTATATTGPSETSGTDSASGTDGTGSTAGTGSASASATGTDTEDTGEGCGVGTPWTSAQPGPFVISYDEGGLLMPTPSRPRPSEDGRYVLFTTLTLPGNLLELWRLDNKCGTVENVPVDGYDPTELAADLDDLELSRDGSTVVFTARGPENSQLRAFAIDVASGALELLDVLADGTEGVGVSDSVSVSADGRFVAFTTNLKVTTDDDDNGIWDIVVRDREAGVTELISVDSEGNKSSNHCYSPSISADGRYVAFEAFASNLSPDYPSNGSHTYVRDRQESVLELASPQPPGLANGTSTGWRPHISADGRYVAFATDYGHAAEDTDDESDVYLLDRQSAAVELVSTATFDSLGPTEDNEPWVSDDGQRLVYIAYGLEAPYPKAALLKDRASDVTIEPTPGPGPDLLDLDLSALRVSPDGAWIVAIAGPADAVDPPLGPGESALVMLRVDALLGP
jgi:Tol biopolymer transport system component